MSHASPLIATDIDAYLAQHERKDLLRFITCGSVDDGKSTLIGRLLHDAALIYEDHLDAIARDSARFGTTGDAPDLALLVDGLQAEREQGITIDVAYRYFSTEKRKFVIADTPGHEQYTRNMATGASTAQAAVLLVDARHGVQPQTIRHTRIVTLLGIRHLVLAINKMDLVDWRRERFDAIHDDVRDVLAKLGVEDATLTAIPLSALHGDNVVHASPHTPWYADAGGVPLMEHLETLDARPDRRGDDLRLPVQLAVRPDATFRGYAGTLASGTIAVGDEVMILPARTRSRVARVLGVDGDVPRAAAPHPVTITLEDERDVSRGDLITHPGRAPSVATRVEADLVWMAEAPLRPGVPYDVKLATKTTGAAVAALHHRLNLTTLETEPAEDDEGPALHLNEVGAATLTFTAPVAFDPYEAVPATGAFILIDRIDDVTVGAGMIRGAARREDARRAPNVAWQTTHVDRAVRAAQKGQTPRVVWFTGLSGAGKSTLADALERRLVGLGKHTYLLDGDNVRHGLNRDLGFDDAGRVENVRRIGEVAKLMTDAGLIVLTAFISPFREDRRSVREMLDPGRFVEVFVDVPLDVAEARDPKGLYARARAGDIRDFTGIDSPYERPHDPEVVIDGVATPVEEAVDHLVGVVLADDA